MKLILALIALFVSACGFHPVYGVNNTPPSGLKKNWPKRKSAASPDREGQYLRNALIDRFYREGRPANPRYSLDIGTITERTKTSISPSNPIQHANNCAFVQI